MKKLFLISVVVFLFVNYIFSQLDTSFGINGISTVSVSPVDSLTNSFELPDGKILVIQQGKQTDSATQTQYNLVRLNSNGSLDTTYGNNGVAPISIPFITNAENRIYDSVRQSDGRIILVGSDNFDGFITRINQDGTLDTTFANNGFHRPNFYNQFDTISKVLLLPNGKIMVFGITFQQFIGDKLFLIRYLPNGALDSTFGSTNEGFLVTDISTSIVKSVGKQSSGKFIINDYQSILRLNADGSNDSSFQPILFTDIGNSSDINFKITNSDNIVISSSVYSGNMITPNNSEMLIKRYTLNGSLDLSFGTNGSTKIDITSYQNDYPSDLTIDNNGKIILSGNTSLQRNKSTNFGGNFNLIKLSSNGTLEGKMLPTKGELNKILVLQSGKFLQYGTKFNSTNNSDLVFDKLNDVPMTKPVFHASPYDFDVLGKATLSVFRPNSTTWYKGIYDGSGSLFGLNDDILVTSDYRDDFMNEIAVFRPSTGYWYIANAWGYLPSQNFWSYKWGQNGDIPAPADFNGDGKSDIAVFRPSNGVWYILNTNDNSNVFMQWGMNGDKPVAGDYDGDGIADIAIWRPSNGLWCIYYSSNNQMAFIPFGLPTDIPVQEDYDGDGKFDIAVWRPSNGTWYRLNSTDWSFVAIPFGLSTDNPIPADYDGDGKTDIAVKRNTDNKWYILNSANNSLSVYIFGLNTDKPLPLRN